MTERLLSIKHLPAKLAAALILDVAAALILNSKRVRNWCDRLDGALADYGDDE